MNAEYKTTIKVTGEIQRAAMEGVRDASRVLGQMKLDVKVDQLPDALADMEAKYKPVRVGMQNALNAQNFMNLVRSQIEAMEQGHLPLKDQGGDEDPPDLDERVARIKAGEPDSDDTTRQERAITDNEPARGAKKGKLRKVSAKRSGYRMERA